MMHCAKGVARDDHTDDVKSRECGEAGLHIARILLPNSQRGEITLRI
jgi:hypothetical protein